MAAPGKTGNRVFGVVVNHTAGRHEPNVVVEIQPGNIRTTTNTLGRYEFVEMPPGFYTVRPIVKADTFCVDQSHTSVFLPGTRDVELNLGILERGKPNPYGSGFVDCPAVAPAVTTWPPLKGTLSMTSGSDTITYTLWLTNGWTTPVNNIMIKGMVPTGAKFLGSYVGTKGSNPGVFDGTAVGWLLPTLAGGASQGPYVWQVDVTGLAADAASSAFAWVSWMTPAGGSIIVNISAPSVTP